ncbi:hypothetical protein JZ751_026745, partial [Albula glossodonta]
KACPLSSPPSCYVPPLSHGFPSPVTSTQQAVWQKQQHPVRMGLPQSLCLLSAILLTTWQTAETQLAFVERAELTVLPGPLVQSGTNVSIQCEAKITYNTMASLNHQYMFYKDDKMVYEKNTTSKERLISFPILGARVANSGTYKCSVRINTSYRESEQKPLTVEGLQTPSLFLNKSSVKERELVTATCSAPKEIGSFVFLFFEGGKEVQSVFTSSNMVNINLKFDTAGNKSLICKYGIHLRLGMSFSANSREFHIHVAEVSITPSIVIEPNTSVTEGDNVKITCYVGGTYQNSSEVPLYLVKGGNVRLEGRTSISFNKIMEVADSGEYECKIIMGDVLKSVNGAVRISELFSVPVLTMDPLEVYEGDMFSLTCHSTNIAHQRIRQNDVKYSITRNGNILNQGDFSGKYTTTAATSSNGNYSCAASAKLIKKNSEVIVFKAKVLVSQPLINVYGSNGEVIVGQSFQVQCHCENGSLPITYTLMKNKKPQRSVTIKQPYEKALFNVNIMKKDELSHFNCRAENKKNNTKESEMLNATVIVPVSKPMLISVPDFRDVTEGTELLLICKVTEGSLPITFKWFRRGTSQPLHTRTVKDKFANYTVDSVDGDQSGTYYCEAGNKASNEMQSKESTIEVKMATWKKALIAALCICTLLVACIAFLYHRHKAKRGKRETATELSVKPSSPKSDDSLSVSLAHDTEVYNAHKGAAPPFDGMEGRAANGTRDSVASLPANNSNRSSYSSPATV